MPLTVFGANLVIFIICLVWLFSGKYKLKLDSIFRNKLMIASIVFFSLHLLGLLWTEDLSWGIHILHKMWYFLLLLPLLFNLAKKEYISIYISSFLLAISITEILSYLVWFELISPFKNATVYNPTPFMSHISYNPILAFATYLVLHRVLIMRDLGKLQLYLYVFFAASMSINMFITGGRAGQVIYFVMLIILFFQFFNLNKIKAFFLSLIFIPLAFFIAFQNSVIFNDRVNAAYQNIITYSDNKNTSVGLRIAFTVNSWEIIKNNPIFGVGTGDFPKEYEKINEINTPNLPITENPHNMYILILVELGLLGVISLISIFYYQIKLSFRSSSRLIRDVGITLPLLFLVIMWSDSYLLGHYTTLIFVFFSSFLYKDFEAS
jgi:O-antigen ligase